MNRQPSLSCLLAAVALVFLAWAGAGSPQSGKFPPVVNTQNPKDVPPTPQQSLRKITVPPGFRVTLFAGEPDVCQPISMDFDDRGRLWVAECFSYPDWSKDGKGQDRILIFEDTA